MPWVRLDDGFDENQKVAGLSDAAFRLHLHALCYCARNLTDGHVPPSRARILTLTYKARFVKELVDAGLWDEFDDGWVIHDFLEFNPSRAKVEDDRGYNARRQAMHKDHGLRDRIKRRDQDMCRYCGIVVKWSDRKGAGGGTYDHIIPRGPNTDENLVVACRGCNSSKGNKTLEEWGTELRPEPRSDLDPEPRSDPRSVSQTRPDPTRSITSVATFSNAEPAPVDKPASLEVVKDSIGDARSLLREGRKAADG